MKLRSIFAFAASLIVSIGCSSPSPAAEGAKGLFFEQMENPAQKLNTGIQYWIELNRDGKFSKVNNKYTFRTGDKIRFHITSNIDGFAYILLSSGSRGEQSVLFPEPHEDNKIQRGKDYSLPRDGFLTFDEHPGIEKVSLLLSRMPTDATAYLNKSRDPDRTLVASAATGSKDLVPSKILLSYTQQSAAAATTKPNILSSDAGKTKVATAEADKAKVAGGDTSKTKVAGSDSGKTKVATTESAKTKTDPGVTRASSPAKDKTAAPQSPAARRKRLPAQKIAVAGGKPEKTRQPAAPQPTGADDSGDVDDGVVTVVYNDPSGVLTLEVDLQHM